MKNVRTGCGFKNFGTGAASESEKVTLAQGYQFGFFEAKFVMFVFFIFEKSPNEIWLFCGLFWPVGSFTSI